MNFATISAEELNQLRQAFVILARLNEPDDPAIHKVTLYGLTSDASVIDAVKEAIADEAEIDDTDVKVEGEVAVAIELSDDVLYYLTGSGLLLSTEEVAFTKGGGNGIDQIQLSWSHSKPRITIGAFRDMAIGRDEWSASTFLQQYGKKNAPKTPAAQPPAKPQSDVKRDGEAEAANKPVDTTQQPAAPTTTSEVPKKNTSSLHIDAKTIEEFLD